MELGNLTQEQLDKLVSDAASAQALTKGYETKVKDLETKVSGLDELDTLKKELAESKDREYASTLNSRLGQITKYLEKKGKSEAVIKRIGDMSNDDFDFFVEGKTDTELLTKEEIESAKTDLETKETEITSSKDQIIKDYLKTIENDNKTKNDQKLVPGTEVDSSADDSEELSPTGFPSMDTLKKVYRLNNNPIFNDKTDKMIQNAQTYMDTYGGLDMEE